MKNILSKLRNIFRSIRVSTWSGNREKSGKTEKIDKSQELFFFKQQIL